MSKSVERNYLEISSLNQLNASKKKVQDFLIELLEPDNFQLNKFFYKNIGKNHHWVDRLVWSDQQWIKYVSDKKNKTKAAIASELSASIYNLEIIKKNIQDEKNNVTRFLLMGKEVFQPELKNDNFITSFLFKLKSKPAALYSALSGFAINGVNMTKLQSFPEKNSFSSFFFLCDIEGHIEDQKIKNSLEELGLHCEDMHVLGVFNSDKFRQK